MVKKNVIPSGEKDLAIAAKVAAVHSVNPRTQREIPHCVWDDRALNG